MSMPATISEAASEMKPKRGRPRGVSREYVETMRPILSIVPESDRSVQNFSYLSRAVRILDGAPGLEWLLGAHAEGGSCGAKWRRTLLAELGRIAGEEDIKEWATILCAEKPTTKAAIARVRRWRLGQPQEPEAKQLVRRILQAIDTYRIEYPGADVPLVLEAINNAYSVVQAASESEVPT